MQEQDVSYEKQISNLRAIRLNSRNKFRSINEKVARVLDSLKDDIHVDLPIISFKDLSTFEKGIWYKVDEEISLRLEDSSDDRLKFNAILKPGSKFALKKHDSILKILVNEGRLIDLLSNLTYVKGDEVIYLEYEPHEHASDIYSEYTIYFHPPVK
jgi:hypothetical protein